MIETSNRGFGVAKPIGDNERYDVILDRGRRRFWRAQVREANSCLKTDSRWGPERQCTAASEPTAGIFS